ncbi:flavofamily protein [Streptococcus pneumoniae SPAR95]|nr:flavofamily protein [Streptococcus pneumoniae GA41538]EJG81131.1 flavofamily protein [Streptococcus pneumoniae SPAR95]
MANILLAVTGSIASYKSADLVSSLKKQGHQVTVLMTQAATEFIQPLTLQVLSQNPVHLDVMKEPYPDQVNHIELGKKQIYLSWYLQLLTLLQN